MKSRIILTFLVILLGMVIAMGYGYGIAYAFTQTTPDDPTAGPVMTIGFPILLLIPYLLGAFLHWFKKYQLDGMNVTFGAWLFKNIIWSATAFVVGLGSVFVMWASNNYGGLYPITIGSCIAVFWVGFGADSINRTEPVTGVSGTARSGPIK